MEAPLNSYRTKMVRVWTIIYNTYRDFCNYARITMSDFVSLLLYHAAFDEPLIIYVLQNEFEMSLEEAKDLAERLANSMWEVGKVLWGEENAEKKA